MGAIRRADFDKDIFYLIFFILSTDMQCFRNLFICSPYRDKYEYLDLQWCKCIAAVVLDKLSGSLFSMMRHHRLVTLFRNAKDISTKFLSTKLTLALDHANLMTSLKTRCQ